MFTKKGKPLYLLPNNDSHFNLQNLQLLFSDMGEENS